MWKTPLFFFLATFIPEEVRTTQAFHVYPKKESTCFSLNISFTIFSNYCSRSCFTPLFIKYLDRRNQAIDNHFTLGFGATEILSCLLNVHGIHLSLKQLRRILKRRGCRRRGESSDMNIIVQARPLKKNLKEVEG